MGMFWFLLFFLPFLLLVALFKFLKLIGRVKIFLFPGRHRVTGKKMPRVWR